MTQPQTPIQFFSLKNFTFHNNTTLPTTLLAYQILNPQHTKTAIVHTYFRGRIATTLTHSTTALQGYKTIVLALFGNGESSSPSNTSGFPERVEYMDCVRAQHALLTHLGISSVDVMLGFSMGGQVTYHWVVMYPGFVKRAVVVCSSARTSRHNMQFLEGPRAALECARDEESGLRAFGKAYSAWLTSAEWFEQQRYMDMGFETQDTWDKAVTETGYEGWSGADLLAMLGMWQRGDVGRCVGDGGGLEDALGRVEAEVLLMPCETDQYFRPGVSVREAAVLKKGKVEVVPSVWGHVAGGGASAVDVEWMGGKIGEFLEG